MNIDNLKKNQSEETVVFKYIRNNPGTIQQGVIDNNHYSKNTISNEPAERRIDRTLEALGEFGLNKLYLALWDKTLDGFSQVIQPQDFGRDPATMQFCLAEATLIGLYRP